MKALDMRAVQTPPPPPISPADMWRWLNESSPEDRELILAKLIKDQQMAYDLSKDFNIMGNMISALVIASGGKIVINSNSLPDTRVCLFVDAEGEDFVFTVTDGVPQ